MSNNSLHDGYSAARTLASSIPDSADFALVISFGMGLNKERATEEILEVFIARSYEARTITIEAERTSVILIGNGIFDKKMRKSDPSNIYNGIKNILGRYVDNGLINVQVYYSIDYYDDDDNPRFEASRCVFTQTVSSSKVLDESFEGTLANEGVSNDSFRIVTTRV